jgi:hypothetical protein
MLDLFLLGMMAGFRPDAALQIELIPAGRQHFSFARAGDDK